MSAHLPRTISTQTVGLQEPDGGMWMQVSVALTRCSCGEIHAAIDEDERGSYNAPFWLGVKYAQLNKWTDLDVPGMTTDEVQL